MKYKLCALIILLANALTAGAVNYSYDAAGRLVKVDYGDGGSISYTYDNAGNLLSRTTVSAPSTAAAKKQKPQAQEKQTTKSPAGESKAVK